MAPDNEVEMQDTLPPSCASKATFSPPAADSSLEDAPADNDIDMADDQSQDENSLPNPSQLDLPFASSTFINLITRRLHWDTNNVMIWLADFALPALQEWYRTCYSDRPMRQYLLDINRTCGSAELFRTVKDIATAHKVALCRRESFEKISEVTALKLTAKAVGQINGYSFKDMRWLSVFQDCDTGGLKIAAALMMDVLLDLTEKGNMSYFLVLLGGKPSADVRLLVAVDEKPKPSTVVKDTRKPDPRKQKSHHKPSADKPEQQGGTSPEQPGLPLSKKAPSKNRKSNAPSGDNQALTVLEQLKAMKVLPPDCKERGLTKWRICNNLNTWEEVNVEVERLQNQKEANENIAEENPIAVGKPDQKEATLLRHLKSLKVLRSHAGYKALGNWRKRKNLDTWEQVEAEVERLREERREAATLALIAKDANNEIRRRRRERGAGRAGRGGRGSSAKKNTTVSDADEEPEDGDGTSADVDMDIEETAPKEKPDPTRETTQDSTVGTTEHQALTVRKRKRGAEEEGPSKKFRDETLDDTENGQDETNA